MVRFGSLYFLSVIYDWFLHEAIICPLIPKIVRTRDICAICARRLISFWILTKECRGHRPLASSRHVIPRLSTVVALDLFCCASARPSSMPLCVAIADQISSCPETNWNIQGSSVVDSHTYITTHASLFLARTQFLSRFGSFLGKILGGCGSNIFFQELSSL